MIRAVDGNSKEMHHLGGYRTTFVTFVTFVTRELCRTKSKRYGIVLARSVWW